MENQDHAEYDRQFFRRLAPWYDRIILFLRPLRRRVVFASGARPGDRVLDVACGTGEQTIAFARAGCSVVGVDLSPDMLARAKVKIQTGMDVTLMLQEASSLPYSDASFDCSTISLALHDMPLPMALTVLREMQRVTVKGGQIVIVEHHRAPTFFGSLVHWFMQKGDTRYYPVFMERGLDYYLQESGLRVVDRFTALLGIFQVVICENVYS